MQGSRKMHLFVYLLFLLAVGVIIMASQTGSPNLQALMTALFYVLPLLIVVGVIYMMLRQNSLNNQRHQVGSRNPWDSEQTPLADPPRRVRMRRGPTILFVVLAVGVIIMAALARSPGETPRPVQDELGAWRLAAVAGIVAAAALALVIIRLRWGPALYLTNKPVQPPPGSQVHAQTASGRRGRIVFVGILFVLAVSVIIMAALARSDSTDTDNYAPPVQPRDRAAPAFLGWLPLATLAMSMGAAGASAGFVAVAASRMVPKNERMLRDVTGEDITHRELTIPDRLRPYVDVFTGWGFTRLGEIQGVRADGERNDPSFVLVSPDRRTAAMITAAEWASLPGVLLVSYFRDDARLATRYPANVRVKRPDYDADGSAASLDHASEMHVQRLAEFARQHGEAIPLETIRQYLDLARRADPLHMPRFVQALNNQFFALGGSALVLSLALAAISLVMLDSPPAAFGCLAPAAVVLLAAMTLFLVGLVRTIRRMP